MKRILYIILIYVFVFNSCKKEEENIAPQSSTFSCKVDGIQLNDSSPKGDIITINPALAGALEIQGESNLSSLKIINKITITVGSAQTIFNNSNFTTNIDYTLGAPGDGSAVILKGNDLYIADGYPGTANPYSGIINFSKITTNKVSGTFSFNSHFGTSGTCLVTEGNFANISY